MNAIIVKPKIGFCVVYHPLEENADKAPEIFEKSHELLRGLKNVNINPANILVHDIASAISVGKQFYREEVDLICVKLATWSSDNLILDMSAHCDVPFIFWAYPHIHAGSLCGGQQFNMVFKELKKDCIFAYKDDESALQKIYTYARCVSLKNNLKKIRLGLIGNRTQGMSEVIYDEFSIKEVFGARILSIGYEQYHENVLKFTDDRVKEKWEEIKSKVGKVSIYDLEGLKAIKHFFALKELIDSEFLSGITLECYPNHMGEVCLAYSLLAAEGFPGACEGDINSLILMYILMNLSGQPVNDIDLLYLHEEDNSMVGSHCGCGSFNLAPSPELIELSNVRLAKKGICVLFPSKPGHVTIVNLVGRKGSYRMGVIEGEAITTKMLFPGNPIRIKLPIEINTFLNIVEERGLGHHWIVAYGNFGNELKILASLIGIDYINLDTH